jgi:GH15 family glucan-1,4-alpha-glucosidase
VRTDGYLPIESYAAIGDGRALGLVGADGAIDWMCLPELDSPGGFFALLDPAGGGRFALSPAVPFTAGRRYLDRTNVLETTFETNGGRVQVLDALTIDKSQAAPWRELVREVRGIDGAVPMRWRAEPRLELGQRPVRFARRGPAAVACDGPLQLGLLAWDAGDARVEDAAVGGEFEIAAGERAMLALLATEGDPLPLPGREPVQRRLQETVDVWRAWVSRHCYDGPWRDAVERSLLAIKLLADGRTGAIAAAGTTSLPEVLGDERNFDYRFGWVRDLCFTLDALLAVGMEELTQASVTWLLQATGRTHPRIDPVYALNGEVLRSQQEVPLPGYRSTRPVHVGNDAGSQLQLGGFGDFVETIATYVDHGHVLPPAVGERLADIGDLLSRLWRSEDSGLWELSERAHYGSSKLACWVGFDRLLHLVREGQAPPRHVADWERERDAVRGWIEEHLFSESRGSYLMRSGDEALDCAMLLAGRRQFGGEERVRGTIDAIRSELGAGGPLLYRYSGMQEQENAFLACSFWMAEAMAISGRVGEAAELMDGAVGLANDVGLYSEELDPGSRAMLGNFPQALTHLALVSAAVTVAGCAQGG